METKNNLHEAMRLISEYIRSEFNTEADFKYLSAVPVGYTTITDEEYPIQAVVDLINFSVRKIIDGVTAAERSYDTLPQLIDNELTQLDFNELVSCSDEQLKNVELDCEM